MKILARTGTILIALVFLLGSTGISFYRHSCTSSNTQKLIVYPGLFKAAVSCCCGGSASTGESEIDMTSCCKSASSLVKLQGGYIPAVNHVLFAPDIIIQSGLFAVSLPSVSRQPVITYRFFEFYSPPFSGKALIHFLHQIKVPSPSSLA